jgi:peptidoglycan/xylan/chitin deacetylase (PgdA/CDA1 family)
MTIFAAARALEASRNVAADLSADGHDVCAHGYRWSESWNRSEDEERADIAAAVSSIEATTGQKPVGWYSRWMRSDRTRRLLVEHGGFMYDADAYNDDLPYYVDVNGTPHLVVPYTLTYNDAHYSYGHFGNPSDFVELCRRALNQLVRERDAPRILSVGLHSRISGQAGRAHAVAELLDEALGRDDVWVTTRRAIAEFWLANYPPR